MTTYLPDFRVVSPANLDEALDALASEKGLVPLAGGTDVMVYLDAGVMKPCTFLNLASVAELGGDIETNGGARLPALSTYRDARHHTDLAKRYPMLPRAAKEVGVLAIQARGTWVGNIMNASPAADGVPALMAYDGEVELASKSGTRRVPLADFYKGYKQMDRRSDELVVAVHLPPPPEGRREYYRKVGTRRFQAISKTLLAGWIVERDGVVEDLRLVFASVAPYTLRARETEDVLRGKPLDPDSIDAAAKALQDEISPIDDVRSSATYRRVVTENLLRDFLKNRDGD